MKNSIKINIIGIFILIFSISACTDQFDKAGEAKKMRPLTISILPKMSETEESIPIPEELTVKMENFSEGISIVKEIPYEPGEVLVIDSVIPGIYSVTISGKAQDDNQDEYFFKGNKVNEPLITESTVEIEISGLVAGKMKIIQVYYCGSKTPNNTTYFRDQFYYRGYIELYLKGQRRECERRAYKYKGFEGFKVEDREENELYKV